MKEITVGVSQDWLCNGQVLAYTITYMSVAVMQPWAAAVMKILDTWPPDRPFLVLHDLSGEGVAIPYLLLNSHNIFNLGITQTGNDRVDAITRSNPNFRARLAVVVTDSFSGKIVKNRARYPTRQNPSLEYKLFFSSDTALSWLVQGVEVPMVVEGRLMNPVYKTREMGVIDPLAPAEPDAPQPVQAPVKPQESLEPTRPSKPQAILKCPTCNAAYRPGELACVKCGMVFVTGGNTNQFAENRQEPVLTRWSKGEAIVMAQKGITLLINGTETVLPVVDSLVIGRASPIPDDTRPDIDLNPFEADTKGVSRLHLRLVRKSNLIYIADLNSSNGSFLNGRRLFPNTEHIVRSGDELQLGYLKITVRF